MSCDLGCMTVTYQHISKAYQCMSSVAESLIQLLLLLSCCADLEMQRQMLKVNRFS